VTDFDDRFAESGFDSLLVDHGERVEYHPQAGGSRFISAIVERDPPAVFSAGGELVHAKFSVSVLDDKTLGISSYELNTGGDEIALAIRKGKLRTRRVIIQMNDDAGGVLTLAVE